LRLVSSYTREAGVRSLERNIGAVCRAVAVKVAEHMRKTTVVDEASGSHAFAKRDKNERLEEKSETVDIPNLNELSLPPDMPVVIDQAAVEDILGVSSSCYTRLNSWQMNQFTI
jgi:ATP-dependent Lon protease